MATNKENLFDKVNGSKWNTGVVFERTNPGPIEKYSVFQSLTDAQTYAKTNAVAYVGQIITVVGGTETYTAWTFSDEATHTMEYTGGKWMMDGNPTTSKNTYDLTATATIGGTPVTATRQIDQHYSITAYQITDTQGTLKKVDADIVHASKSDYGTVKVGNNVEVNDGVISVRVATLSSLGLVKIGTGLDVTADGTISAQKLSVDQDFTDKTSQNPVSTKAVNDELTAHYVNKEVVEGTATSTDKLQKKSDVSADIKKAIEDLDYVGITAQQGEFISAISETDGVVTASKGTIALPQANVVGLETRLNGIDGDITGLRSTDSWLSGYAETKASEALSSAKEYADGIVQTEKTDRISAIYDLSVELKGDVSTEATRADTAEKAIDSKVGELSGKFETVSADHETRITTAETAIGRLSSAMHFRGVITEVVPGQTIEQTLVDTFKPCAKGDVALYTKDGTEFVYASDLSAETSGWYILGDEITYVTKATYNTKMAQLDSTDSTLCGMVETETSRAKGVEDGLSADLYSLSGKYDTFTGTTYVADKAALQSTDSEISGKVDNKVKVGTGTYSSTTLNNVESLSVVKIGDEDYYRLVAEGKQNNDVMYIVSSDYVNGHDQRIINVGTAVSATDAVNLSGMTSAIEQAKSEIVANALSGVRLNGQDFEVTGNVAILQISCINCGGAL